MLKKDVSKGFCIGVTMTMALCLTVPAYASTYKKQLEAVFSGIKIVVDGYQITPKDGAGKVIEPFIVDGTTYLPVRAVAEALGKPVTWDSTTQTVYLGEVKKDVVGFDTLKPYKIDKYGTSRNSVFYTSLSNDWKVRGGNLADNSNAIAGRIVSWGSKYLTYGEYNLDGDYTKFSAKIAVDDRNSSDYDAIIRFYSDDSLLKEYVLGIGDTQDIEISTIGTKTLKIEFSVDGDDSYPWDYYVYPIVYDAKFYPIN